MLDDKLDLIPEYIENIMKRVLWFDFGRDSLEKSNNSILSDGEIDYKKVVKMIRNCIAHSNYKVLDDGTVEFYNDGKNKLNFTVNKKDISSLFDQLSNYYYLEGM